MLGRVQAFAGLCAVAALSALGCGGSTYGDFSNVPTRESCTLELAIPNMACSEACPVKVSSALGRVAGVRSVEVDYEERSAVVEAVSPACSEEGFEAMMEKLYARGYKARVVRSYSGRASQTGRLGSR
jgi:copper chaperone CopZ